MKRLSMLAMSALLIGALFTKVQAQDAEITDEQLRRYAMLQEVVTAMKKDISTELNAMIKAQDGMTGKRYKELAATKGDAGKLEEIGAKDFEIKFLELTDKMKNERTESIKTVNSAIATKMIGDRGKVYKKIKDALSSDTELKARYDAIVARLQLAEDES